MALLAGLTGGMGSGKTSAAACFKTLGAHVIDADEICRELVQPGQPAWKEIIDLFGEDVLNPDQTLNRKKLAALVFEDEHKKKLLEKILHPKVFAEEEKTYDRIRQNDPQAIVIVDAALLIESGNFKQMDQVIVITCDRETQIQRAMKRGNFSREDVESRIQSQMNQEEKIKYADHVLDNSGTLQQLKEDIGNLFVKLKTLA